MAPVKPVLCLAAYLLCLCRADFNPSAYTLPPGFSISLYQGGLMNARGLARSEAARKQVIIYVGSKGFSNPPAEGTKDDKVFVCTCTIRAKLHALACRSVAGRPSSKGPQKQQ